MLLLPPGGGPHRSPGADDSGDRGTPRSPLSHPREQLQQWQVKLLRYCPSQLSAIRRAWWGGGRIQEEGEEMQKRPILSCGSRVQEPFSGLLASDNHPKMKK